MRRCPSIFEARELRSKAKYRDLSRHLFAAEDIVWLCEEMQGGLHEPWSGQVTSLPAVGRRYRLEVAGLRLWRKLYHEGYIFTKPTRCLPLDESVLDRYSMRAIRRWKQQQQGAAQDAEAASGADTDGAAAATQQTVAELLAQQLEKTRGRAERLRPGRR
jgi:hypothetical protein